MPHALFQTKGSGSFSAILQPAKVWAIKVMQGPERLDLGVGVCSGKYKYIGIQGQSEENIANCSSDLFSSKTNRYKVAVS